jgi:hypothetical protein
MPQVKLVELWKDPSTMSSVPTLKPLLFQYKYSRLKSAAPIEMPPWAEHPHRPSCYATALNYNKHYPVMYSWLFYQCEACERTQGVFLSSHITSMCGRLNLLYIFQLFSFTEVRLTVCVSLFFWTDELYDCLIFSLILLIIIHCIINFIWCLIVMLIWADNSKIKILVLVLLIPTLQFRQV